MPGFNGATSEPINTNNAESIREKLDVPSNSEMNTAIQQLATISNVTLTSSGNANINGMIAQKTGNIVTINGYLTASSAFGSTSTKVCTIAAGARPGSYLRIPVALSTQAYLPPTNFGYLNIDTNGSVNIIASSGNTGTAAYFNITYIAQN